MQEARSLGSCTSACSPVLQCWCGQSQQARLSWDAGLQLELRDVKLGRKTQERRRPYDMVEVVRVESHTYQFLFEEGLGPSEQTECFQLKFEGSEAALKDSTTSGRPSSVYWMHKQTN